MAATNIGTDGTHKYPLAKMPVPSDAADIQIALRNYHYGQDTPLAANAAPTGGIAKYLYDIEASIAAISTDASTVVQESVMDAKGDLFVGTANNAVDNLTVGSDGYILTADSTQGTFGLKWAAPTAASTSTPGVVQLSDSTSTTSSILAATPTAVKAVQDSKSALNFTIDAKTADYSLVLSDAYKIIEMNITSTANTLTIPLASVHEFPQGSQITIIQTGSGQTTISGTAGVTINGTPGLKLRDQYSSCTLIKRSAANLNTWIVIGDLSA
jgi:hypothetical protein